jgi:hypothetical protein
MCDPVTAIAAAGSLASLGGSLYEGSQAQSQLQATQTAQNKANDDWVAYQTRIHQQQVQAEDAARQAATGAQQATLQKVAPEAQQAQQTAEQARLNTVYNKTAGTGTDTSNPQSMLLSGEQGGNQQSMDSITSQVNQATAQARGRIAALATANSYGGSFGGLGTTTPITFAQGANNINYQNAMRQGNLKTYGVEQQVQPINYAVGPGTEATMGIGKQLGGIAGTLAGYAGPRAVTDMGGWSGIGGMFGGTDPKSMGINYGGTPNSTYNYTTDNPYGAS